MNPARIAVLVSGGGTNLQALIDAQKSGILHSGTIAVVISNNPNAFALERARQNGIASEIVRKKALGSQAAFEDGLQADLKAYELDLTVLGGLLRILSENFTRR